MEGAGMKILTWTETGRTAELNATRYDVRRVTDRGAERVNAFNVNSDRQHGEHSARSNFHQLNPLQFGQEIKISLIRMVDLPPVREGDEVELRWISGNFVMAEWVVQGSGWHYIRLFVEHRGSLALIDVNECTMVVAGGKYETDYGDWFMLPSYSVSPARRGGAR